MKLIFDRSVPGRRGVRPVEEELQTPAKFPPALLRDKPAALPSTAASTRLARAR